MRQANEPDQPEREPACDYTGWDLSKLNPEVNRLRAIRAEHGVGAMLAHASGMSPEQWRAAGGIDRPAGPEQRSPD